MKIKIKKATPLADLHTHVGGAVDAAIMWTLAHEQGIKLPTRDYWQFYKLVTITSRSRGGFAEIDHNKYHWTELIQSSPSAMEAAIHGILGGAYRANNIVLHEIRYNPMKRNRGGERDLDYIILSTIRGMERAILEYPEVRAGLILMLDRGFTYKMNRVIYEKALKYQHHGIIGVDIAGPQVAKFRMAEYVDLFVDAKRRGFGVTIHTGEEGQLKEMGFVVDKIHPHRIGHGVMAYASPRLMAKLKEQAIALEVCPTSNLNVGVVKNFRQMKRVYRTLWEAGVRLTINTDGPEMHGTTLGKEFRMLEERGVFTLTEIQKLQQNAFDVTFIKNGNGLHH